MDTQGVKRNMLKVHDMLLIVACIFILATAVYQSSRPDLDPEDFMVLNKVYIPDHPQWVDTPMIYDRDVRQDFDAKWTVIIESATTGKIECKGSGQGKYRVGEELPDITLSWYIGKHCDLPPGDYFASTIWELPNGVILDNTSNVFEVYAAGKPSLSVDDNR